jgi:hypothetical protein
MRIRRRRVLLVPETGPYGEEEKQPGEGKSQKPKS